MNFIEIKTPQLIGIILGCLVFFLTLAVVFYLLIASNSLKTNKQTSAGNTSPSLQNSLILAYPELYDDLIEAKNTLKKKLQVIPLKVCLWSPLSLYFKLNGRVNP
jgi:hypothetical protein